MRREGPLWRWLFPILLIGGTLLWLRFALYSAGPNLIKRATPVTNASEWRQEYSGYFWRSDNEILFAKSAGQGRSALFSLNLTTGQSTPLTALNAHLHSQMNTALWRLSPDGQWLLVLDFSKSKPVSMALNLDGKRKRSWPLHISYIGPYILWMPDSQHWVEVIPRNGQMVSLIHSLTEKDQMGEVISGPVSWPVGVNASNHLLDAELGVGQAGINEYGIEAGVGFSRKSQCKLPRLNAIPEVEPSPKGDRIAFLCRYVRNSPLQAWFSRMIPGVINRPSVRYSLHVAYPDGSGVYEIGQTDTEEIAGIQWTPDGKRLTFFARDTLYSVPVGKP